MLASGGASYPGTGTVGEGYRWLAELGLEVSPPRPALCPLRADAAWVEALEGLTLSSVEAQLRESSGRILVRRRRPILFTRHGVSGPGAMDLSRWLTREPERYRLHVDLVPDLSERELAALCFAGPGKLLSRLRRAGIPKRLAIHLLDSLGIPEAAAAQVPATGRRRILASLKGFEIPVRGSLGFRRAELTTGGLCLDEADPRTMQVRSRQGLYVTGELLDVDGPIGGFGFLVAFTSGVLAGRAIP